MRRFLLAPAAGMAGVALLLTGCGGEDTPPVSASGGPTTNAAAPGPNSSTPRASAPRSTASGSTGAPAPVSAEPGAGTFTTADGNIGCDVATDGVRCDISAKSWEPPARPPVCEGDYGNSVFLAADRPRFTCASDTLLGAGQKLAQGKSVTAGDYTCENTTDGVRCRNTRTGRGFLLSREAYRQL